MNEYTPTTPESNEFDELANLRKAFENAKDDIARMRNNFDFASQAVESWKQRFDRIKAALTEFADEGAIEEGNALDDYLIEEFEIELYESMDIKVTVTYEGTITVPKGADIDEIDTDYNFPWTLQMRHGGNVLEDQEVTYDDIEVEKN
jgi:hypothetical protein